MVAVVRDQVWKEFYEATNPTDPQYKRVKEANNQWRAKNRPVVIRDEKWNKLYSQTNPTYSEEKRIKEADTFWIVITKYEQEREARKASGIKKLLVLPHQETPPYKQTPIKGNICQAVTLSNTPCKSKAVSECGRFCKKHLIV